MNKKARGNAPGLLKKLECRQPVIEFTGNKSAVIYGCRGVAEYGEEVIRVNSGELMVSFFGKRLELKSLNTTTLEIEGFIREVHFTS